MTRNCFAIGGRGTLQPEPIRGYGGRKILAQIGAEAGERVFAPVGLDLGAEGPEQVAIAIVGELLALHASRQPWSLREKEGAIHAG